MDTTGPNGIPTPRPHPVSQLRPGQQLSKSHSSVPINAEFGHQQRPSPSHSLSGATAQSETEARSLTTPSGNRDQLFLPSNYRRDRTSEQRRPQPRRVPRISAGCSRSPVSPDDLTSSARTEKWSGLNWSGPEWFSLNFMASDRSQSVNVLNGCRLSESIFNQQRL